MLVTMHELLKDAQEKGYAIGAFNFHNQDILEGIILGAEEVVSPVIVQITPPYLKSLGIESCAAMAREIIKKSSIPVVLHFDHGNSFDLAQKCLMNGFSSVMFDGSHYTLEDNIKYTAEVVKAAHALGVTVEGELGSIGGVEDDMENKQSKLINPLDAERFVNETNIDVLAPAVGTAHGIYKETPKLDYERIEKVKELTNIPLALHGGSGLSEEQFELMIAKGVNKINIGTQLKLGWTNTVKEAIDSGMMEPMKIKEYVQNAIKEIVKEKIRIFGSANKA